MNEEKVDISVSLSLFILVMNDTRNKVLKMVMRCKKYRKHKPAPVQFHVVQFGGLDAPLFPESEIKEKRFSSTDTLELRNVLRSME